MAKKLDLSSSYISSIETGKRKVTKNFLKKLKESYDLNDSAFDKFRIAAEESLTSIPLDLSSANDSQKGLALSFAKKFSNLDQDTITRINKLINNGGK